MSNAVDRSLYFKVSSMIIGACVATASAVVYFYENYKIPLKQLEIKVEHKDQDHDYIELQGKLSNASDKEARLEKELNDSKAEITNQATAINELQKTFIFYPTSYYPAGSGLIKVGDDISLLKKYFKEDQIQWTDRERESLTAEVTSKYSYFKKISYDYHRVSHKIVSIDFHNDIYENRDYDFLLKKITEIAGIPTKSKGHKIYRWQFKDGVDSYLFDSSSYVIMADSYAPVLWNEPDVQASPTSK